MTPAPLVVVVEDDPASRRTLGRVLRAGGFEPATYASAEDYLAAPPADAPLGMVLDVHLGLMSGLDLQLRLRRSGSTLPIIVITALDDARSQQQAESQGCLAFLRKPCEASTILGLLRTISPVGWTHLPDARVTNVQ